jgi:hypothetical protein
MTTNDYHIELLKLRATAAARKWRSKFTLTLPYYALPIEEELVHCFVVEPTNPDN